MSLLHDPTDPETAVVPQLRQVAAWLASMRADVFEAVAAREPELLLASDVVHVPEASRAALVIGEYGFPESHAASFALLVYASSWLKCHEPAAFLAAMLNSQPMGFYSPSQLVQDAKRHGVQVAPVDVTVSGWDSVLERREGQKAVVVRLGLSLLKGMRDGAAERIESARAVRPFLNVGDLARRAQLDRHDLQVLASANALASLAGNRREALWQSVAAVPDKDMLADACLEDDTPVLGAPSEAEDIVGDYKSTGLTLGRHPLELLRPILLEQRLIPGIDSANVSEWPARSRLRPGDRQTAARHCQGRDVRDA